MLSMDFRTEHFFCKESCFFVKAPQNQKFFTLFTALFTVIHTFVDNFCENLEK